MNLPRSAYRGLLTVLVASFFTWSAQAQSAQNEFRPEVGQEGKDVVWVPTPQELVEKMLDMAKVTPRDFVIDLGSGDGRNVIAAAKRGARALGVEYNGDMVRLSRGIAVKEGVADKATFVEGDMYEADISKATVLALFLLPNNLQRLLPKFLDLKPGSRIVANTFGPDEWQPDERQSTGENCVTWCYALLWIVPAKVEGTWGSPQGNLTLSQKYQLISGTLAAGSQVKSISNGRLRGEEIKFSIDGAEFTGRVNGDTIEGTTSQNGTSTNWRWRKVSPR